MHRAPSGSRSSAYKRPSVPEPSIRSNVAAAPDANLGEAMEEARAAAEAGGAHDATNSPVHTCRRPARPAADARRRGERESGRHPIGRRNARAGEGVSAQGVQAPHTHIVGVLGGVRVGDFLLS
mmetsp:Transcript_13837/g.42134  ORF Transcript_13837/g.42134 Transcript_13837/m.42134 type:complete len:124 (-) Transcript_13837:31-402(-)